MKKTFIPLLAVLLLVSLFMGCAKKTEEPKDVTQKASFNATGYPVVDERIVFDVMNAKHPAGGPWGDDMSFFRGMKKVTNIDFNFMDIPRSDWDTKMNLALASGDLPDVFMWKIGLDNIFNYGVKGGLLVDISDMIETYMPNLMSWMDRYPDMLKVVTQIDGGIYSFPKILRTATSGWGNMYIRTDYMNQAGIEKVPETVTEFYNAMKAIQKEFSDVEGFVTFVVPNRLRRFAEHYEVFMIPAFGDYLDASYNVDSEGKVFHNGTSKQYYRFLEFTHKLYKEKILSNEMYTMDSATSLSLIQDGKCAVTTLGTAYDANMSTFKSGNFDVALMAPLTSEYTSEKKINYGNILSDSTVCITTECENVEAMLRWYDILYSEEDVVEGFGLNNISSWMGVRGETWDYTDDTKQHWVRNMPEDSGMNSSEWIRTYGAAGTYLALDMLAVAAEGSPGNTLKGNGTLKNILPYVKTAFPLDYLKFTEEKRGEYVTLMGDIDTYLKQMEAKFITGEEPLSNYDKYVDVLENMGLSRAIELVQEAYDKYIQ